MKTRICIGTAICSILLINQAGFSQTTSGVLTQNETWSGKIALTGDITVPSGVTLTVMKGTVISRAFNSGNDEIFLENGSALIADGSADEKISIVTSEGIRHHSGGIYLRLKHCLITGGIRSISTGESDESEIQLDHCSVSGLGIAIEGKGNYVINSLAITGGRSSGSNIITNHGGTIKYSGGTVQHGGGLGLISYNGSVQVFNIDNDSDARGAFGSQFTVVGSNSDIRIFDCNLSGLSSFSLSLTNSSGTIENCIFKNNDTGCSLFAKAGSRLNLINCIIEKNDRAGIGMASLSESEITISSCSIEENQVGVQLGAGNVVMRDCQISRNEFAGLDVKSFDQNSTH